MIFLAVVQLIVTYIILRLCGCFAGRRGRRDWRD